MFGHSSDFETTLAAFDELRRRMQRVFDETDFPPRSVYGRSGGFPRTNLYDSGNGLVLTAEVAGLTDKDVKVELNHDVLTVTGERKSDVPEGYSVHRQERVPCAFSRSFALPTKVDPDRTSAVVKNGVLTVTLEKAAEVKPRQIAIRATE